MVPAALRTSSTMRSASSLARSKRDARSPRRRGAARGAAWRANRARRRRRRRPRAGRMRGKEALNQSTRPRLRAEVGGERERLELHAAEALLAAPAGRARPRPRGSGRSTASGRRPGTACGRRRAPSPRSASRAARTASTRCPGTRRPGCARCAGRARAGGRSGRRRVPSARSAPCAISVKSAWPRSANTHLQLRGGARQEREDRVRAPPTARRRSARGGMRRALTSAWRSGSVCCSSGGDRVAALAPGALSCVSSAAASSSRGLGMERARVLEERSRSDCEAASSSARVGATPVLRSQWSRFASMAARSAVAVATLLSRCASSRHGGRARARRACAARPRGRARCASSTISGCAPKRDSTGIWRVSEAQNASMVWMRRRWRDLGGVRQASRARACASRRPP